MNLKFKLKDNKKTIGTWNLNELEDIDPIIKGLKEKYK